MKAALAPAPTSRPGPVRSAHADVPTLSTGDVARLLQVAPRTVSCWIDSGQLKGYRVPAKTPNSSDQNQPRRVYADDLVGFLKKHGMRVPPGLEPPAAVVVFAINDMTPPAGALVPGSAIEFGAHVATERLVTAILGDDEGLSQAIAAAKFVRARHPECRILFAISPDADAKRIAAAGFGDCPIAARPIPVERIPQMLAAG